MKRMGILLLGMVLLSGSLAYLFGQFPRRESSFALQNAGAGLRFADSVEDVRQQDAEPESGQVLEVRSDSAKTAAIDVFPLERCYAYQTLTEEEKTVYSEILDALVFLKEEVGLSCNDTAVVSKCFQCVLSDHPEIFYVDGYVYTEYTLGEVLRKLTFSGNYRLDREEISQKQELIDSYVNQCLAGMPEGAEEYEKVKYIYEYLIHNTEYDAEVEDKQNICSVFIDGRSVCQGYAKATQYLLLKAGVYATLVQGRVISGESHAWNLAMIDGQYYYVDTTWGDASYQAAEDATAYSVNKIPTINYDYLCVTTEQLKQTHYLDNIVALPECTSMDANYYVREGEYFTSMNEEQLAEIFRKGYENGSAYVTLKCASLTVYRQIREALIEKQGIFGYLDCPEGVVSYTENEKQYSMSFWL